MNIAMWAFISSPGLSDPYGTASSPLQSNWIATEFPLAMADYAGALALAERAAFDPQRPGLLQ